MFSLAFSYPSKADGEEEVEEGRRRKKKEEEGRRRKKTYKRLFSPIEYRKGARARAAR